MAVSSLSVRGGAPSLCPYFSRRGLGLDAKDLCRLIAAALVQAPELFCIDQRSGQLTPVLKYRAWKVTLQFLPRSLRGAQSGFAFSPVMGSQLPRRRKNLPFLVFLALVRLRRRTSPDG